MNLDFLSSQYKNCRLCHRLCGIDRTNTAGRCGMTSQIFAARAALHYWEEPCISGECGSGAVFFSGCSLGCVYCQNHDIALGKTGRAIDTGRLAEIFLELMEKGAANINLVTPTHYIPSIIQALDQARLAGFNLPVVYNTGNYETVEALKLLEGYVDIYLPDFKYWSSERAKRYSGAPDYAEHAVENIKEMFRQVGEPVFAEHSLMKRGIIVRHLMLPGSLSDSKRIIEYLYKTYGNSIYLSIMNQFTPLFGQLTNFPELSRNVSEKEYNKLIDYAIALGVESAYIQEGETVGESFIPAFDYEGI